MPIFTHPITDVEYEVSLETLGTATIFFISGLGWWELNVISMMFTQIDEPEDKSNTIQLALPSAVRARGSLLQALITCIQDGANPGQGGPP